MVGRGDFPSLCGQLLSTSNAPSNGALPSYLLHGSCGSLLIHLGIAGGYSLYLWCSAWLSAADVPHWFQPPQGVQALTQTATQPIVIEGAFSESVSRPPRPLMPATPIGMTVPSPMNQNPRPPEAPQLAIDRIPPAATPERPPEHLLNEDRLTAVNDRFIEGPPVRIVRCPTPPEPCNDPAERPPKRDRGRHASTARSVARLPSRAEEGVDHETLPQSLYSPPPEYPAEPYRRRVGGVVKIAVQLNPDGSVGEEAVYQSSGDLQLDEAALKAVGQWRFEARSERRVTARRVIVPIRFIPPS